MTGREFEIFMYLLFKELGYKTKLTEVTGDGGKDIILKDKFGDYIYVECKRWGNSWKVGRPELQKLVGAAYGDCINKMIFVTTGEYSNDAIKYSYKIENMKLWDMSNIMRNVLKINKKKIPYILNRVLLIEDNKNINNIIKLNPDI
jgi:restriction system protein